MMLKRMVPTLLAVVLLAACAPKPPSKDEVQAAVQDAMKERALSVDGAVRNLAIGAYDCARDGDGFMCTGRQSHEVVRRVVDIGAMLSTQLVEKVEKRSGTFHVQLAKGEHGWVRKPNPSIE
ncbi:hypothetical protein DBR42_08340 [Pelomonas sp. HMWF004]|nr:hypothetical protein DBR42_08340 [Pelomonas sp. HMWF004]